jgi:hypothetical protein
MGHRGGFIPEADEVVGHRGGHSVGVDPDPDDLRVLRGLRRQGAEWEECACGAYEGESSEALHAFLTGAPIILKL